jgi:hypothetical protein
MYSRIMNSASAVRSKRALIRAHVSTRAIVSARVTHTTTHTTETTDDYFMNEQTETTDDYF